MLIKDLFNCPDWLENFSINDEWRNAKVIIGDNNVKFELDTENYLLLENDEFRQFYENKVILIINEEEVQYA